MSSEPCPTCYGRGEIPGIKTCPRCGRLFRWQDDAPGKSKRFVGVVYCSGRCARAEAEKARRRRVMAARKTS